MNSDDSLTGRDNSFTFLRLVFAIAVVFGHSFVLGGFGEEPLSRFTAGHIAGREIAVQGFFIMSGFLMASSLARSPSVWRFSCHRAFRILPAFWLYLIVMVFCVAPAMIESYAPGRCSYLERLTLGPDSAWRYFTQNWMVQDGTYSIVPLFADNPHPFGVNGSLWSVCFEVCFYVCVAVGARITIRAGVLAALLTSLFMAPHVPFFTILAMLWRALVRPGFGRPVLFGLFFLAQLVTAIWPDSFAAIPEWGSAYIWPLIQPIWRSSALFFLGGMVMWQFRDRLSWRGVYFVVALAILVAAAIFRFWQWAAPVALPYVVLYLAARLPFRNLDRFGDPSYGIYIFSFPAQQLLIFIDVHTAGPVVFSIVSIVVSVALGWASWILVEKRCVELGRRLGNWQPGIRQPVLAQPAPTGG